MISTRIKTLPMLDPNANRHKTTSSWPISAQKTVHFHAHKIESKKFKQRPWRLQQLRYSLPSTTDKPMQTWRWSFPSCSLLPLPFFLLWLNPKASAASANQAKRRGLPRSHPKRVYCHQRLLFLPSLRSCHLPLLQMQSLLHRLMTRSVRRGGPSLAFADRYLKEAKKQKPSWNPRA